MLYYRFRSPSELSFKELLYSEIYFASTEECNDPFDSRSFYEFGADQERWRSLFELSLGKIAVTYPSAASCAAAEVVKKGSLTFDEVMSMNFAEVLRVATNNGDPFLLEVVTASLARIFELYKPASNYFVSFSKRSDEPLMWSHYAGRHEGYCLVFRSVDGALHQNPLAKKTFIRRNTPNSFSPSISHGISDLFQFRDIEYKNTVEHLNAFDLFPQSVAMKSLSEEERIRLVAKQEEQYFQKHESWGYEEESRITLRAPMPWLLGDRFEYAPQERLFQYEPSQLVGVILGARMSKSNKDRISQIVEERSEHIDKHTSYKRIMFDFLLQEAKLSMRHRRLEITPLQFVGAVNSVKPDDEKFDLTYERWKAGGGIEFDGNKSTRVWIPD